MGKRAVASGWMGGWMALMLALVLSTALGQAPPPPQIQYEVPAPVKSQRAGHSGPGMIDVRQPSFPAEIIVSHHEDGDWLAYTQVINHGTQNIVSAKLGWAYVLPTGLDFHSGEVFTVPGGPTLPRGNFAMPAQNVASRTNAKDFLDFVEEVTLADGTVVDADHAQIAAFYTECCTAAGARAAPAAAKARVAPAPEAVVFTRVAPRVNAQGLGIIPVPQPDLLTEIVAAQQSAGDLLVSARLHNRSLWGIHSYRMGWAYALPTGLEYHTGDLVTLDKTIAPDETTDVPDQYVAPHAGAKEFLFFVDEETQGDGTIWRTSHEKIEAQYRLCCSKRNAAGEYVAAAAPAGSPAGDAGGEPIPVAAPIKFDVVSLRPAKEPGPGREMPGDGDFIAYHGSTMNALLQFAYGLHKNFFVIAGQPAWVDNDLWEFQAKVAPEDIAAWKKTTLTEKRIMVRAVLVEQFKLKVRVDLSEHPVYNLVVAKGGPRLTEYKPGDTVKEPGPGGRVLTGQVLSWFDPFNLVCQDETMADLVHSISGSDRAGRVVFDKTGLTGAYNFTVPIPYRPLPAQLQQIGEDSGVPSFFEGLKKLGLQLVSAKGMIDGIVVDHIEKPEAN